MMNDYVAGLSVLGISILLSGIFGLLIYIYKDQKKNNEELKNKIDKISDKLILTEKNELLCKKDQEDKYIMLDEKVKEAKNDKKELEKKFDELRKDIYKKIDDLTEQFNKKIDELKKLLILVKNEGY